MPSLNQDSNTSKKGRRGFLKSGLALWGASSFFGLGKNVRAESNYQGSEEDSFDQLNVDRSHKFYEALIIGSGFGGAVTAARLSKQFGDQTLIVERGKRYPKGSFARDFDEFYQSFWRQPADGVPRPLPFPGKSNGVFDLRSYEGLDTLVGAGFGGGSLIYSAAIAEPKDPEFDKNWPESIKRDELTYYFDVYKKIMGSRTVPNEGPQRKLIRQDLFQKAAEATGGQFQQAEVAINFGNDFARPDDLGAETINSYGALQTSCQYCAECFIGCNYAAKNSLDLNYLYVAENKYGAEVMTETEVEKIIPLDEEGLPDASASGEYGYLVYMKILAEGEQEGKWIAVKSQRVIISGGVYGSNELLFRNKLVHRSLTRVSSRVGQGFSGNGDFMNLVFATQEDDGSNFGPTVTLEASYNREKDYQPGKAFVMEDLSFPSSAKWMRWIVQIFEPRTALGRQIFLPFYNQLIESIKGNEGQSGVITVLLGVGLDKSDGAMRLNWRGKLRLKWDGSGSRALYENMIAVSRKFKSIWKAKAALPFPTYLIGRNFTVHPLGGCALADSPETGVVSSDRKNFGAVFGYENLYVADGSIIPSAVGANPSLTIGALAEMVAEGITGEKPTTEL